MLISLVYNKLTGEKETPMDPISMMNIKRPEMVDDTVGTFDDSEEFRLLMTSPEVFEITVLMTEDEKKTFRMAQELHAVFGIISKFNWMRCSEIRTMKDLHQEQEKKDIEDDVDFPDEA